MRKKPEHSVLQEMAFERFGDLNQKFSNPKRRMAICGFRLGGSIYIACLHRLTKGETTRFRLDVTTINGNVEEEVFKRYAEVVS